ncbi:MAG: undecaprenyl-diphosphatase UppP [Treponema sp.]|nr:MAG: undecaprenyl-diphosphatase UppP [Treponema sp.]
MTILEAILLGFLQGVAEFLPISSSGHLAFVEAFLGRQDVPILFDILLHVATLAAVITVYARKIGQLFCVLWRFIIQKKRPEDAGDLKFILAIIVATVFTGAIGFLLKDIVRNLHLSIVSCLFIVTGLVLILSEKTKSDKNDPEPNLKQASIIGIAQGLGVFPGISRSGSTIAAAILCGVDRKKAGEFSFILSIPAILAALMLELSSADNLLSSVGILPVIAGFITAFIVGLFSLKFLLRLINKGKLKYFAFYLIPLGAGLFVYFTFFA